MKIKQAVNLADYTSFAIGGPADYFCRVESTGGMIKAVNWAKDQGKDFLTLGGGSNILVSDRGYRGLVIKAENQKINRKGSRLYAEAGVVLADLLSFALVNNLSGLEPLAGIPGRVGGAVWGNSGTRLGSIGQVLERVQVFDGRQPPYYLKEDQCAFGYRQSCFQKKKLVILKAVFKLKTAAKSAIKQKLKASLKTRAGQPKGKSAGSVFKNPVGASAGKLIDQAGLKGKTIGQAQISPVHANWIVNLGEAKAADVLQLIRLAKKTVREKFKVVLKEEICLIGDFDQT